MKLLNKSLFINLMLSIFAIMNNYIYRLNKLISDSNLTLPIMTILILSMNLFLLFGFLSLFIITLSIISTLSIIRFRYLRGDFKFDRSVYDVPEVGEIVRVKRAFFWNGSLSRTAPKTTHGSKPWYYIISKDSEFYVTLVEEVDSDWVIYLNKSEDLGNIYLNYFESRRYWESKSNIRDNKLKKLGI